MWGDARRWSVLYEMRRGHVQCRHAVPTAIVGTGCANAAITGGSVIHRAGTCEAGDERTRQTWNRCSRVPVCRGALAAGGLYYVAHRISQKIHEEAGNILGSSPTSTSPDSASAGNGSRIPGGIDVCRLLSKEDVGRAVGVAIARAQPGDNSCSYIAKGDKADMLAKHTTAMLAARGADQQTQQKIQKFAGGMFKTFQSEQPASEQDTSGEVPVFSFSVDQNAAEEQMRLNQKMLGVIGDQESLPGLGDQAFVSADGMILMRKGKNFVRIMFIACPCDTEAVKPLAKEIADAL